MRDLLESREFNLAERSNKAIPINIPCFLFIHTEIFTWFVLGMLIYPIKKAVISHDKCILKLEVTGSVLKYSDCVWMRR